MVAAVVAVVVAAVVVVLWGKQKILAVKKLVEQKIDQFKRFSGALLSGVLLLFLLLVLLFLLRFIATQLL